MDTAALFEVIGRLRHPQEGCPWDREQRLADWLKPLREETEELAEAIAAGDTENIRKELGDVFFNVCMLLAVAEEDGLFRKDEAVETVRQKMIARHPHVFAGVAAADMQAARELYQRAKSREKADGA